MDPGGCASSLTPPHIQCPPPSILDPVGPAPPHVVGSGALVHASGCGIGQAVSPFPHGQNCSLGGTRPAGKVCCESPEGPRGLKETCWQLALTLLQLFLQAHPSEKVEIPQAVTSHTSGGSLPT
ncbi:unnamed protein product [Rangifer tarandus platyrhynchus]|uniref:Uncharacterized protein n=2 Tax=Rangifer tarandus platyrhynchus TaxID=3082113 RepID=A0ABN8ZJ69_RANTA|nr:unnamed protein product [Rangifer tarandus platyrhynchus]